MANKQDSAQLYLSTRGFWISGLRGFNVFAKSSRLQSLEKLFRINVKEKMKHYDENFTPLVMSANASFEIECKHFYA